MIAPGNRIRVVAPMADDPLPPPLGAEGTVVTVESAIINNDDGLHYKAHIKWDSGIVAVGALLIPQDNYVYEVVS